MTPERTGAALKTVEAIREAGLRLVYEHGYEGMGLRQLAAEAGVGLGSLYNHFPTKQALLVDLITLHMDDLVAACDAALPPGGSAVDRLTRFVRFHVRYHLRRKREVFICYSELRSLEPENYSRVAEQRRLYERRLIAILEQGVAEGVVRPTDVAVAAYALLAMLSGVCNWFRDDGRLDEDEVCAIYMRLALAAVTDPAGLAAAVSDDAEARALARREPGAEPLRRAG